MPDILLYVIAAASVYAVGAAVRWLFFSELRTHAPDIYAQRDERDSPLKRTFSHD